MKITVIAAVKDITRRCVFVASDSQVTAGHYREMNDNVEIEKIFRHGDVLFAGAGTVRGLNLMQYAQIDLEKYSYRDMTHRDVVTSIVPSMFKIMKNGHHVYEECGATYMSNQFIIASGSNMFSVGQNGEVLEYYDFVSSGSGGQVAEDAWISIDREKCIDPILALIKTMVIAAKKDVYVNYPIVIHNTADPEQCIVLEDEETAYECMDAIYTQSLKELKKAKKEEKKQDKKAKKNKKAKENVN